MLTKEQIESFRNGQEPRSQSYEIASLALVGLAVQPRPLAEIEDDLALIRQDDGDGISTYVVYKNKKGHWLTHLLGRIWSDDTLAVPLSALSAPTALEE